MFSSVGNPTSYASTDLNFLLNFSQFNCKIFFITVGCNPVVYEFIRTNKGLSLKTSKQSETKLKMLSSIFQISPLGPLP